MANMVPYENITQSATAEYGQAGWKATKQWIIDGCDASDPDSTIITIINSDLIPARGDGHPSGEDMQADEIKGEAISSTQVRITVTYKKLSPVEMEPDDSMPALMTIGSTVQQQETSVDFENNTMTVPYTGQDNAATQFTIKSTSTGNTITNPTSVATGNVQIPNTVIRFARREQNSAAGKIEAFEAHINSAACQWGDLTADKGTLLCTRIEDNTNDGGNSYVVEYEFQYNPDGWDLFAFYTLPNGTSGTDANGNTIGPGDIPPDAGYTEYQIYGEADFNQLSLV